MPSTAATVVLLLVFTIIGSAALSVLTAWLITPVFVPHDDYRDADLMARDPGFDHLPVRWPGEIYISCDSIGNIEADSLLKNDLINCKPPSAECKLLDNDPILNHRRNILCKKPPGLLLQEDFQCAFRSHDYHWYSYEEKINYLNMSCLPLHTPTVLLYSLIPPACIPIVLLFLIFCWAFVRACCRCCCRHHTETFVVQQDELETLKNHELFEKECTMCKKKTVMMRRVTSL